MKNGLKWSGIGGLAGYLGIGIFCLFGAISAACMGSQFSPFDVWIGDFGNQTINPSGTVYYNTGCMMAGVMFSLFFLCLIQWRTGSRLRNYLLLAGSISGSIAGVMLFITGYLSPDVVPLHLQASILFFAFTFFAIVLISLAMFNTQVYSESAATMGLTVVALTVVLAVAFWLEIEPIIAEWFAAFALLVWVGLTARDALAMAKADGRTITG